MRREEWWHDGEIQIPEAGSYMVERGMEIYHSMADYE